MLLSDTEAVVECSERVNMERTIAIMMPLQFWLGQKVKVECRAASPDEIVCPEERRKSRGRSRTRQSQDQVSQDGGGYS